MALELKNNGKWRVPGCDHILSQIAWAGLGRAGLRCGFAGGVGGGGAATVVVVRIQGVNDLGGKQPPLSGFPLYR